MESVKGNIVLIVAGALAGAALTYSMTGLEPGSKADWMAAGGTWVIGIAACALTFLQVRSTHMARDSGEVRQLRVMSVRAKSLCVVATRVAKLEDHEILESASPRIVIGALERRCSAIHLDLALVDTDDDFEQAVAQFDYHVMAVQSICQSILNIDDARKAGKLGGVNEFKWLTGQLESLMGSQKALETQIQRKISEIKKRGLASLK